MLAEQAGLQAEAQARLDEARAASLAYPEDRAAISQLQDGLAPGYLPPISGRLVSVAGLWVGKFLAHDEIAFDNVGVSMGSESLSEGRVGFGDGTTLAKASSIKSLHSPKGHFVLVQISMVFPEGSTLRLVAYLVDNEGRKYPLAFSMSARMEVFPGVVVDGKPLLGTVIPEISGSGHSLPVVLCFDVPKTTRGLSLHLLEDSPDIPLSPSGKSSKGKTSGK